MFKKLKYHMRWFDFTSMTDYGGSDACYTSAQVWEATQQYAEQL